MSLVLQKEEKIGEGVSTFVLLVLIQLSVTGSIAAANWADGLSILTGAALGGLVLGFLLAKFPVRGRVAHPFMLVSGLPAVAFLAGMLLPDALTLREKMIVLTERFWLWMSQATFGGVSTDNLMFVVQVAYFAWIMGYLAGWFVYRRHAVWGAIIPTGVAITFNLFYAFPQSGVYFTLYILCALLLIIRTNLHRMERWWRAAAVGYSGDISFDFFSYGVMFSIILMVLAWVMPTSPPSATWLTALEPIQGPWKQAEDQFNRVFSSLRAVARPVATTFIGTTLTMGGPVNLGQRPVMDIQAIAGRYWRASVYDKYTGIGWFNTHIDALNLGVGDPRLNVSPGLLRVDVTQTFKVYLPDQNMLFAQSQPVLFSMPTEIRYAQAAPSDSKTLPVLDVALTLSRRPLREGDTYTAVSAISVADEDSLRQASTEYSAWIAQSYLQLPDSLPERVRALAKTITAQYKNPYDKATAIEQYLRKKIKYNDQVSEPPQGRDRVDYTLFDRPEGYCNYYASAMAVLARSVGIPARVASGYSLGDYDNNTFHVIEANAHSWVEVFFPGYGWIEFEPTASKPTIDRPKKSENQPDDPSQLPDELKPQRDRSRNKELEDPADFGTGGAAIFGNSFWNDPRNTALVTAGIAVLFVAGAFGLAQWQRSRRIAQLAPAARFYERLVDRAGWLGVNEQEHATPFERAHVIGEALPKVRDEVEQATVLYVREKFGARTLTESESQAISTAWTRVRAELWRGIATRILLRIITPPREFARRVARAIERWGNTNER